MNELFAGILLNMLLIAATVTIHYEFLYRASDLIPHLCRRHRPRILVGVLAALIAHTIEIGVFGIGYYLQHHSALFGQLQGNFDGSLADAVYFSFTTFSTLGFGDIEPIGPIRYTAGLEALTGLVLITWSASFLFVEMQRYWHDR